MANSLSPAFVRINYQSAFGLHSMTVPSVPIVTDDPVVGGTVFDLRGAAVSILVPTGVTDFVNVIKPYFPTNTTFIDYLAFVQPTAEDVPEPIIGGAINIAGSNAAVGWSKAVQLTWTWRTDSFGVFKLVMLDAQSGNTFEKITFLADPSADKTLSDYVTSPNTWLAGRDGGRPQTFLQCGRTLNEKLRRAYRMN